MKGMSVRVLGVRVGGSVYGEGVGSVSWDGCEGV